ncbi:SGNH/GDSL hydrolase family protein [Akkermansiaceae bacterium]|nr:SGNH/GDSL hydrolase family protein [Akkermansiaceae bacterium]
MGAMTLLRPYFSCLLALLFSTSEAAAAPTKLAPDVLKHLREIHAGFNGQEGSVAQFGDSITYSMAFWSAMSWSDPSKFLPDDGLPKNPSGKQWKTVIKGARDKGQKFANYSGWKVGNLLKSIDTVLARDKPEAALIMIGTNDTNGKKVPESYRADLEQVITKCLAAHCVPILNTIPPRRDHDKAVEAINLIIHEIATAKKIPLADFHAECLRLRPGKTWDGTLISEDGVHPSGGKTNLYDESNLKSCGYALRNWVNFLAYRQVFFGVFEKQ